MYHSFYDVFFDVLLSVTVEHVVIKGPIDLNDTSAEYKHIEPHSDANSSIRIVSHVICQNIGDYILLRAA